MDKNNRINHINRGQNDHTIIQNRQNNHISRALSLFVLSKKTRFRWRIEYIQWFLPLGKNSGAFKKGLHGNARHRRAYRAFQVCKMKMKFEDASRSAKYSFIAIVCCNIASNVCNVILGVGENFAKDTLIQNHLTWVENIWSFDSITGHNSWWYGRTGSPSHSRFQVQSRNYRYPPSPQAVRDFEFEWVWEFESLERSRIGFRHYSELPSNLQSFSSTFVTLVNERPWIGVEYRRHDINSDIPCYRIYAVTVDVASLAITFICSLRLPIYLLCQVSHSSFKSIGVSSLLAYGLSMSVSAF